jgi:hypothetical protein
MHFSVRQGYACTWTSCQAITAWHSKKDHLLRTLDLETTFDEYREKKWAVGSGQLGLNSCNLVGHTQHQLTAYQSKAKDKLCNSIQLE